MLTAQKREYCGILTSVLKPKPVSTTTDPLNLPYTVTFDLDLPFPEPGSDVADDMVLQKTEPQVYISYYAVFFNNFECTTNNNITNHLKMPFIFIIIYFFSGSTASGDEGSSP